MGYVDGEMSLSVYISLVVCVDSIHTKPKESARTEVGGELH